MRQAFMLCVAVLTLVGAATAQKIIGKSNTGSLSITISDTNAAATAQRVRNVSYEYEFSEPSGNNALDPKETGRLRIVLTNSGKITLRNLVVKVVPLSPPAGVTYNDSIMVGDIPVNATRYAIFYFTASNEVGSQILTFQIDVHDPLGSVADSRLVTFLTRDRKGN
jgi:hypothetical protein